MSRFEDEMLKSAAEQRWARTSYGCVSAVFLAVVGVIILFF
jgi:hypothetical protein